MTNWALEGHIAQRMFRFGKGRVPILMETSSKRLQDWFFVCSIMPPPDQINRGLSIAIAISLERLTLFVVAIPSASEIFGYLSSNSLLKKLVAAKLQ